MPARELQNRYEPGKHRPDLHCENRRLFFRFVAGLRSSVGSPAFKLIENHLGRRFIKLQLVQSPVINLPPQLVDALMKESQKDAAPPAQTN